MYNLISSRIPIGSLYLFQKPKYNSDIGYDALIYDSFKKQKQFNIIWHYFFNQLLIVNLSSINKLVSQLKLVSLINQKIGQYVQLIN